MAHYLPCASLESVLSIALFLIVIGPVQVMATFLLVALLEGFVLELVANGELANYDLLVYVLG